MRFCVLSSGSRANCTYIEAGQTRLLIDAGLSARETERRLKQFGVSLRSIHAILLTHEHFDHIRGAVQISKKFGIPVFANRGAAPFLHGVTELSEFVTGRAFTFGEFCINPFPVMHDAVEPVGFCLEGNGLKFTHATDLGTVTKEVRDALHGSHALLLESNHDLELLYSSHYPWPLKERIASSHGHLSNTDSAALLRDALHDGLRHVILGHISENSNTPQQVVKTFKEYVNIETFSTFTCAVMREPTAMIHVDQSAGLQTANVY